MKQTYNLGYLNGFLDVLVKNVGDNTRLGLKASVEVTYLIYCTKWNT